MIKDTSFLSLELGASFSNAAFRSPANRMLQDCSYLHTISLISSNVSIESDSDVFVPQGIYIPTISNVFGSAKCL
jgi:hypothetical protein